MHHGYAAPILDTTLVSLILLLLLLLSLLLLLVIIIIMIIIIIIVIIVIIIITIKVPINALRSVVGTAVVVGAIVLSNTRTQ